MTSRGFSTKADMSLRKPEVVPVPDPPVNGISLAAVTTFSSDRLRPISDTRQRSSGPSSRIAASARAQEIDAFPIYDPSSFPSLTAAIKANDLDE